MRFCLLVLILLIGTSPLLSAAEATKSAALDDILRTSLQFWHTPGIAVAVVRDDKVIYLNGHGLRQVGSDKAVTPDTLFAIGSCTKAFTATALAVLVQEGKAEWDDPVRHHLPSFRLHDPLADHDVRLCDLLCHRIGLARHDLLWYRAPWSIEESVRRMAYLERSSSFRSTYEYNNLAYLAAGFAIDAIAKQPWHTFVSERLLKPLNMNDAVFTSGAVQKAPNHASPHSHDVAGKIVSIPWYDDDRQIRASGSIKASARDLSQWLRFQLADGRYEGKQVVSADALAETHTPHIPTPLRAAERAAGATQASYALGWHITEYRGYAVHKHGGAVDGFRARIILVPRKKLGIVLLTNLDETGIVEAAGNNLLDCLLGLEKKDWNAFFEKEKERSKEIEVERLRKRRKERVLGTRAKDLDVYLGTYFEPAYGTVKITQKDDVLVLNWSRFEIPLRHFHFDTFVTPAQDGQLPAALRAETAVFEMNEDAEMSALRFLGRRFARKKDSSQ
jgi:CubicO group peptidase (beta-lactamase class C family)